MSAGTGCSNVSRPDTRGYGYIREAIALGFACALSTRDQDITRSIERPESSTCEDCVDCDREKQ